MFSLFACCGAEPGPKYTETCQEVSAFNGSQGGCVSFDADGKNVTYTSDVDGRWDFFCNFVEHSQGLKFAVDMEPTQRRTKTDLDLQLGEGWHFVYGGDACVPGSGTLRFLEAMVRLKRSSPGKVHLLLGPKDMEVQRWTTDLCADFESRREELALLSNTTSDQISDDQVAESCEQQMKPGGWTWEYLQLAQVGIMLGDTLFVHGEILSSSVTVEEVIATPQHQELLRISMVPEEEDGGADDTKSWVARQNGYVREQIRLWDLTPQWEASDALVQQAKLK